MNRQNRNHGRLALCLAFLSGTMAWAAQEIDPFYLQSLKDGEAFFAERNFRDAAVRFDIAAFGLSQKKDTLGRVRVFLALCYDYLGDGVKAEENLKAAYSLLGPAGLASVAVPDRAKADLLKLLRRTRLDNDAAAKTEPAPPAAGETSASAGAEKPALKETRKEPVRLSIQELEEIIAQDPRQNASYYDLARLYTEAGKLRSARKVYQKLVDKNPAEIRGYLELGKIAYRERSLREADKHFEKFLSLAKSFPLDIGLIAEAKAYSALSASLRGGSSQALRILQGAPELQEPGVLEALPLDDKDRTLLLQLLERLNRS